MAAVGTHRENRRECSRTWLAGARDGDRSHVGRSTLLERIEHNEITAAFGTYEAVDDSPGKPPAFEPGSSRAIFDICRTTASRTIEGGRIGKLGDTDQ